MLGVHVLPAALLRAAVLLADLWWLSFLDRLKERAVSLPLLSYVLRLSVAAFRVLFLLLRRNSVAGPRPKTMCRVRPMCTGSLFHVFVLRPTSELGPYLLL